MLSLKLLSLLEVQKSAPSPYRKQAVLGEEQRVVFAEALTFRRHVSEVVRIILRHILPIVAEVPFDAVPPLKLKVGLLDLFEQSSIVPGSAVMNTGTVGSGAHRLELFTVLVFADVLRLVDFKKDVGGIADHISRFVGGKEDGAGAAESDNIAELGLPYRAEAGVVEPVFESHHRDDRLGLERGRALDEVLRFGDKEGQQQDLKLRRELVFPALPGDFHGKGKSLFPEDAIEDGGRHLFLVRTQLMNNPFFFHNIRYSFFLFFLGLPRTICSYYSFFDLW